MENSKWFTKKVEDVEKELQTNVEKGLTTEEVTKRQEKYGLNELKAKKKKSLFQKFLEQFKDFSIIILIIAAIISFFLPGIGQIIQGADVKKGIIMFIIAIVLSYLLMNFLGSLGNIIYLLYAIYAAYDAYKIEV